MSAVMRLEAERVTNFDKIWQTTANLELDDSHSTKHENF